MNGGRIDLFGRPVPQRWTRLAATAGNGTASLRLATPALGWQVRRSAG